MTTNNNSREQAMSDTRFIRKFTDEEYQANWESGFKRAVVICNERDLSDNDLSTTAECLDREASRALDDGAMSIVAYNRGQTAYLYRLLKSRQVGA